MARIPDVRDLGPRGGVQTSSGVATIDAGYISRGVQALGAGLSSMGDDLGRQAKINQENQSRDEETAAKGTLGVSMVDIDTKADGITDPDQLDKVAPEYEGALGRAASAITDPRRRQQFVDQNLPIVALRKASIGKVSKKFRDDTMVATADDDLSTLREKAVTTEDPDLKAQMADSARGIVEGLQRRGVITAVEGGKRLRQWGQDFLAQDMEVRARQALASGDVAGARAIQAEAGGVATGDRYAAVPNATGLVERGNIDLYSRPRAQNADGSISTVRSISVEEDGKEILIPTVSPDGRILTDDQAVQQYHQTGQNLGKFATAKDADTYAEALHKQQEAIYRGPPHGRAMQAFIEKGWSPAQAAGIVGNLMGESGKGLNPRAVNPGDGADGSDSIGIAQWNGSRAAALKQFAAARGKPWDDIETQVAFIDHELRTSESAAGSALSKAQTPDDAATAFLGFERPQGWKPDDPTGSLGYRERTDAARQLVQGDSPMRLDTTRAIALHDRLGAQIDDYERGQTAEANDAAKTRKAAYDQKLNQLQLDIIDDKAGATDIQAAREAGWLNDADGVLKLQQQLQTRDKDAAVLGKAVRAVADPNFSFDPLNTEDRNYVSALAKANQFGDRLASKDRSALPEVNALVERTGIVPREVKGTLGAMVRSDDVGRFTFGMSALDQIQKQSPAVFGKEFDDGTAKQLATWQTLLPYKTPEEIMTSIRGETDPTMQKIREDRTSQAKKLGAKITLNDVVDVFDPSWLAPGPDMAKSLNPRAADGMGEAMRSEYETLFADRYAALGDEKAAREAAGRLIQRGWGPSVTADGDIIRRPPDNYYPAVDGSRQWMVDQLNGAVEKATGLPPQPTRTDDVRANEGFRRWALVPTNETDADIARGAPPRYLVGVRYDDGRYGVLMDAKGQPREWRFDPSQAQGKARRQFNEARDFYSNPGALELDPLRDTRPR